ncbi:MAG TPA: TonB-dependent receptor, partial [Caulobacteraceae bacterium]|nr:TonB-dependent receptor [Caulobacteraceae bacterium]
VLAGTGLTYKRDGKAFVIVRQGEGGSGPQDGGAGAGSVDALIVTAQKREEAIQDVPIAISAFSQESLDAQKLEGGFDLLKAIPNVTFSKNNFTSYNFSIRGVGTKAVSATTDPGVAVSFNNTTLIVNRLFEQEYFDVERVEVLRGPQGTLFGRNATSGVINVVSAKPRLMDFEGDLEVEVGNYNARRLRGLVNIPIGDAVAVRAAGSWTKRDGYGINLIDGSDVDGRDLWSTRLTVAWEPTERIRGTLLWEHFEEDDNRVRTSKQLCHRDPGGEFGNGMIGDFVVAEHPHPVLRAGSEVSQGCLPGSLYEEGAFGTPNGAAIPFVLGSYFSLILSGGPGLGWLNFDPADPPCEAALQFPIAFPISICQPDPYGGRTQSTDLRAIESVIEPAYRASADIFDLSLEFDLSDSLTLVSQTLYNKDEVYSTQDFNRFKTLPVFDDTAAACGNPGVLFGAPCAPGTWRGGVFADLAPGGFYDDPQLGRADTIVGQDISQGFATQFNQEFRLSSNFDGPVNFSMGVNYTRFRTEIDYYIFFNMISYIGEAVGFYNGPGFTPATGQCYNSGYECIYIDPNPLDQIDGDGHNYFRSKNPYRLTSAAAFGELYWEVTPTLKLTTGLRLSWDKKTFTPVPSQTLLVDYREVSGPIPGQPYILPGQGPEECDDQFYCAAAGSAPGGRGYVADPDIVQEWREPTGRIVLDWKPDLGFTDDSMFYASYARGYKGGGANPPGISAPSGLFIAAARGAEAGATFDPEYVNAFELGSKNTLLGGGLILNVAAFHYDYTGYQVSKIVDRAAFNENIDAKVSGVEVEWIFSPTRNLRFNGAFGHLQTEIAEGERSIDLMDRTQGGNQTFGQWDRWMVLKPWFTTTSNCIAPVELVEAIYNEPDENYVLGRMCLGGGINGNSFVEGVQGGQDLPDGTHYNPLTDAPNAGAGFSADLGGNDLPNAPHWTAALGAQYSFGLPAGWEGTLRGDFYWQSQSFARIYNTQYDKLRAWTNTNVSLWFEQADWGVTAEVYVKNVFDEMPITDAFLNSDDAMLTTNVFTLDPRLVGVSIRKSF